MINFSKEETNTLTEKLQRYFNDELDQELGQFQAQFLLEFISEELGAYFYNRGLLDAQAILELRMDSLRETIDELQKTTEFSR